MWTAALSISSSANCSLAPSASNPSWILVRAREDLGAGACPEAGMDALALGLGLVLRPGVALWLGGTVWPGIALGPGHGADIRSSSCEEARSSMSANGSLGSVVPVTSWGRRAVDSA